MSESYATPHFKSFNVQPERFSFGRSQSRPPSASALLANKFDLSQENLQETFFNNKASPSFAWVQSFKAVFFGELGEKAQICTIALSTLNSPSNVFLGALIVTTSI